MLFMSLIVLYPNVSSWAIIMLSSLRFLSERWRGRDQGPMGLESGPAKKMFSPHARCFTHAAGVKNLREGVAAGWLAACLSGWGRFSSPGSSVANSTFHLLAGTQANSTRSERSLVLGLGFCPLYPGSWPSLGVWRAFWFSRDTVSHISHFAAIRAVAAPANILMPCP